MKEIFSEALAAIGQGRIVALSTIVSARGSLPMSRRAKMLVLDDGTLRGTVGGGCLEAEVYACGRKLLGSGGPPVLSRFTLTEKQAGAEGLNCGGTVEIFTEVLAPGAVEEVLGAVIEVIESREEALLATLLQRGSSATAGKILVRSGGRAIGSLGDAAGDEAAAGIAEGRMGSDLIGVEPIGGGRSIFLESIDVVPRLVLFGGGHVSREVARVAKGAGFRVVVVDDRPAFANPERHPEADETLVMPFEGAVAKVGVDRWTYLVAVTRGHSHDEVVIREAAGSPAAYVGMIGSRRKVALMKKKLEAEGGKAGALDRLSAPIGLDIGADAPGEIAVSIVAELIAVRRKGSAPHRLSLSRRDQGSRPAGSS